MSSQHSKEIRAGDRFAFGENWARFLTLLNESRISQAEKSLCDMLQVNDLRGKRLLDIGSGSGLFSLAARRLGATVHSFDYDPQSVACTRELKARYFPDDPRWSVEEGSVLDEDYVIRLGRFDIVYAWGVLHHTGDMWRALDNISNLVGEGGKLFISIYNDQGRASRIWLIIKQTYNRLPQGLRWLVLWPVTIRFCVAATILDLFAGRNPFHSWRDYPRGMSPWRDIVDWVGGLPFEVARPEQVFRFFRDRGFRLEELETKGGGLGCNEFVFQKP